MFISTSLMIFVSDSHWSSLFILPSLPAGRDPLRAPAFPDIRGRTPALWLLPQSKIFVLYRHGTDTGRSTDHQARLASPLGKSCVKRGLDHRWPHTHMRLLRHHPRPIMQHCSSTATGKMLQQRQVRVFLLHFIPFIYLVSDVMNVFSGIFPRSPMFVRSGISQLINIHVESCRDTEMEAGVEYLLTTEDHRLLRNNISRLAGQHETMVQNLHN